MTPEELKKWLTARPFVPFRLHITDGASYEVHHPDMLLVGKRSAVVGVPGGPGEPFYDYAVTVVLLHITRIEPLPQLVPAAGNGQAP